MASSTITVAEVQAVLENMGIATSRRKLVTIAGGINNNNPQFLLRALLTPDIIEDPIAYKLLQNLVVFFKDGLLEESGLLVFETIEEMVARSLASDTPARMKTAYQELSTGLFSHACSALQGDNANTILYLKYLLNAMLGEGTPRWNAYSCVGPLLWTRLDAFAPYATTLLRVMPFFPESLSVIHDLYQLAPDAFVQSMDVLMKLYESNSNGHLSILDIIRDLAKENAHAVAPYLAELLRIAEAGGNPDDVATVKELEITCAHAPPPPPSHDSHTPTLAAIPARINTSGDNHRWSLSEQPPSPAHSREPAREEPEDFDERAVWCNALAAECRDVASLRAFLRKHQESAARYLRHVGQVMPLPFGLDATSKDHDHGLRSITLQFKCASDGPSCVTRASPLSVSSASIQQWIKLFVVMVAKSALEPTLEIRLRRNQPDDRLAVLLDVAAAALSKKPEEGGSSSNEEAMKVLANPFLGTDDLADLIVDLRADGIFSSFHYDVGGNVWTCTECGGSGTGFQKSNVSGYLIKKGRRLGREVKRYYMLDEAHLFYATNERRGKPKRRIPVAEIVSVKEAPAPLLHGFEITLRSQKRAITLRATTHDDMHKWISALEGVRPHAAD